ncbi:type III secretion system chaperone [Shewanella surugensis]|uniref:Type III secretion system chaperone n=1 Tax=Shewanella surugensis TaxID=212020 RepID=A0ABT0LGN9_9GAMM|nr:type III secretion system chaperone [Shewanella surugensis]MCL1126830.1 type III secretion system chaperone [Shewanella surugensis]
MYKDDFIAQLRLELGNPALAFNSDNVCRLVIDNQLVIDLEWLDDNALYMYSDIGHSPLLSKEQLTLLLEANAFGQGTGKACFAINNQHVTLQQLLSNEALNIANFTHELELLIAHALQWQNHLLTPD